MEFAAGVLAGIGISVAYFLYRLYKFSKKYKEELSTVFDGIDAAKQRKNDELTEVESLFVELTLERERDTYYLFAAADDKFICQGQTVEEIVSAFKLRCPNKLPKVVRGLEEDVNALRSLLQE